MVDTSRISKRRNGDNRGMQEMDDILKLLMFLDGNKSLKKLPRYVTGDSKKMPTARLEARDIYFYS